MKKNDKYELEQVSKYRLQMSIQKKLQTRGKKSNLVQRYQETNWQRYQQMTENITGDSVIQSQQNILINSNSDEEMYHRYNKIEDKQSIEDARVSNFSFQKFVLLEDICSIITYLSLFLNVLYSEPIFLKSGNLQDTLLYVISLTTLLLLVTTVIRYYYLIQLRQSQKLIKQKTDFFSKLRRAGEMNPMLLQIFVILFHPNYLCKNLIIEELETYDLITVQHRINDLLAIALLFRSYIIIRGIVNNSKFASPRASRLCRIHLCDPNFMYSAKCLLKEYPLRVLSTTFMSLMFIFGYGLKLSEGPLKDIQGQSILMDFTDYSNSFWCVIVTMGTIGYGDYFPKTLPGRFIIVLTAISGVILSSLLIVSLSAYLTMGPNQSKSHICIKRLTLQKSLSSEASSAMVSLVNLGKQIKGAQNEKKFFKDIFVNLKTNTEKVKVKMRQIKSLIDNDNIHEEMARYFTILKKHLKEIYVKQKNIKQQLHDLQTMNLERNPLNIANEVEQMVRKMHN